MNRCPLRTKRPPRGGAASAAFADEPFVEVVTRAPCTRRKCGNGASSPDRVRSRRAAFPVHRRRARHE